jgi:hypothetical protein
MAAIQTYIVSLIKTKQFKDGVSFIDGLPQSVKAELIYEHAYILHRNGNNKEALAKLKTVGDLAESKVMHLMS